MAGNVTIVAATTVRAVRPASPPVSAHETGGFQLAASIGKRVSPGGQVLPVQPAAQPVRQIDFSSVLRQLNAFLENGHRSLQFRQDAATGRTVMTVVNPNTQEVIRQVPAEELLALARNLQHLEEHVIDAEV